MLKVTSSTSCTEPVGELCAIRFSAMLTTAGYMSGATIGKSCAIMLLVMYPGSTAEDNALSHNVHVIFAG